jgi:hypothetical protein
VAACGGPAGSSSHDTPDGAVRGLVNALADNDLQGAQDWILPAERAGFANGVQGAGKLGLKTSFTVQSFSIVSVTADRSDANRATVRYSGDVAFCISGTTLGRRVDNCTAVQSQVSQEVADTFLCVRQNGRWYVSVSGQAQGRRAAPVGGADAEAA